jgi:hypothetical protein
VVSASADQVANVPLARRGGLLRKYVVVFVVLVSGALVTSGLVEAAVAYQDNQATVVRLQRERAAVAASTIERFLREVERQLGWVVLPPDSEGERRASFERLLQLETSVRQVSYFDAAGTERLRVARPAQPSRAVQADPALLLDTRSRGITFGQATFRDDAELVLPIGAAERGPAAGVVVADLSLLPVWDVIARTTEAGAQQAYLVDAQGRLIVHPDPALAREGADLAASAQVRAVRGGPFEGLVRSACVWRVTQTCSVPPASRYPTSWMDGDSSRRRSKSARRRSGTWTPSGGDRATQPSTCSVSPRNCLIREAAASARSR